MSINKFISIYINYIFYLSFFLSNQTKMFSTYSLTFTSPTKHTRGKIKIFPPFHFFIFPFFHSSNLIDPKIITVPEKLILDMYNVVWGRGYPIAYSSTFG